jgi:hypothetical protein
MVALGDEDRPEWLREARRMGWWWPGRGAAVSNNVPDLPPATAMSLTLLLMMPSTTPSRCCLPLPAAS